jgi:hypothetical protein
MARMRPFLDAASYWAIALLLVPSTAQGASIAVHCPAVPPAVTAELQARVDAVLTNTPLSSATLGLDCDLSGTWLVWVDGSRALVDQQPGLVQGVLLLVESRLAWDRNAASHPTTVTSGATDQGTGPNLEVSPNEVPPNEDEVPPTAPKRRSRGTEGGVGVATMAELWSGTSAVGIGPRLDVSVGPPGPVAIVIGEGMLFGLGSSGPAQVTMFDLQAGVSFGAPFKTRKGFGGVLMFGAERISASNAATDVSGLWEWTAIVNLGARASVQLESANIWFGADAILRTSEFETGSSRPVHIPTTSFLLSIGCFFPALGRGSRAE